MKAKRMVMSLYWGKSVTIDNGTCYTYQLMKTNIYHWLSCLLLLAAPGFFFFSQGKLMVELLILIPDFPWTRSAMWSMPAQSNHLYLEFEFGKESSRKNVITRVSSQWNILEEALHLHPLPISWTITGSYICWGLVT